MYRVSYWERLSSGSSSVIVGFSVSVFTSFFKRTFGCWVLLLRGLVSGCEGRGSLSSCAAWALCCGARALAGKAVAAHSSGLACRITGTGEPGGPPSLWGRTEQQQQYSDGLVSLFYDVLKMQVSF